jgi:hypothetical protein
MMKRWPSAPAAELAGFLVARQRSQVCLSLFACLPVCTVEMRGTIAPRGTAEICLKYRVFVGNDEWHRAAQEDEILEVTCLGAAFQDLSYLKT